MKNSVCYVKEPLLFEKHKEGREGLKVIDCEVPENPISNYIDKKLLRETIEEMPELSEVDVVRHFYRLSVLNYNIDKGMYPLGSCTMKYNPKINEYISSLPNFLYTHPYQPEKTVQGNLQLLYTIKQSLCSIFNMDDFSLQPAAGAHGELTGMMLIRAYLQEQGNPRKIILIPDSAHGTNPASATLCGYKVKEIKSAPDGCIDLANLEAVMNEDVAALMLTNPNTLGLFEKNIVKISEIVHSKGGQIYCDGANMNALVGIANVGAMGIDVLHLNLHKTFSTPHGGGGPGSGPVGIKKHLSAYLPIPTIEKSEHGFYLNYDKEKSIGKIKAFYGNFAIIIRALAYILAVGSKGLKNIAINAVANANYLKAKLKTHYHLPYDLPVMHEVIFSDKYQHKFAVSALDIAKRLIDYGLHPSTIYFPLIVSGAIMVEPTETESIEELDRFINAMISIANESQNDPEMVKSAPHTTPVKRLNETEAARKPILRWTNKKKEG